jgi:hypothetical protein
MSLFQKNAACPFCKKANKFELSSAGVLGGLQSVQCSHCRESWRQDFSENETLHDYVSGLQKSAPAASADLDALRRNINASFTKLLDAVTEAGNRLAAKRAEEEKAAKKFKPLQTGERLAAGVDGLPVRKDRGPNSARRSEDVVKVDGAVHHEIKTQERRFVPGGVEKSDKAIELMKTARDNRVPAVPGLSW